MTSRISRKNTSTLLEYAPITTSSLYRTYDEADGDVKTTISRFQNGVGLQPSEALDGIVVQIRKFNFPLREKVLDAIANHRILVMHSEKAAELPLSTSFPFLLIRSTDGTPRAYLNLTPFAAKLDKLSGQKFYAISETALVSLILSKPRAWEAFLSNPAVVSSAAGVFADLVHLVLDSRFMIGFDETNTDRVRYIVAKYFMRRMLGMTNEKIISERAANLRRFPTPQAIFDAIDGMIDEKYYTSFDQLITGLTIAVPQLSSLSLRKFVGDWVKRYDESTIFALEYLPFFLYMLLSVERSSPTVNIKAVQRAANDKMFGKLIKAIESNVQDHYNVL